jgi:hypothetical protein
MMTASCSKVQQEKTKVSAPRGLLVISFMWLDDTAVASPSSNLARAIHIMMDKQIKRKQQKNYM